MTLSGDTAADRLAIIAGGGLLPSYVAEAARAAGENPVIVALKDESDRRWEGYDHAVIGVGDFAALEGLMNRYGIGRVVMSGSVRRRPEWREVRPTLRTLMKMPATIRTLLSGGDDTVLQMVIRLIEGNGRRVVGAHEIAPDLLAYVGPLGAAAPGEEDRRDIRRAADAAEMLGRLDVGQGAVAIGGRIVALEGLEGTDEMLERVADLRAAGRISPRRRGALVKLCKPQQDIRADLPAIGVSTVLNARKAGLAGVAVEAGRSLVLDRAAVIKAADEAGLFVCGIDRGLPAWGLE
ncbi:LpxI family protein [Rhizobium leguminosarum]|uniref:LpxI family protein n=1 Tax=Rhizobium leguminosarum TaxID=384 RepID=UPI001A921566|nr:LpxI family protein [Rhizobium leguminosarum]MBY5542582.1 LpxI family protein [Rhizobium leguminosarum]MBY5552429.1 LpxI family protein [Rhizobium leguminosarum]MBY5634106.1 LpxI family protein [Rhizobium leguminosarum]MBY5689426.1 LpxI family protein [Rhizobium leguminosarum]MBY5724208.1 LpxI family protein [Rhizobium leguminosarum]